MRRQPCLVANIFHLSRICPSRFQGRSSTYANRFQRGYFVARSTLRNHTSTSFAFHKYWDESAQRTVAYDQGGKLIEDNPQRRTEFRVHAAMVHWEMAACGECDMGLQVRHEPRCTYVQEPSSTRYDQTCPQPPQTFICIGFSPHRRANPTR